MEILYLQLEKLLTRFVDEFMDPLLLSKEYARQGEIPGSMKSEYWCYLESFKSIKTEIESYPYETKEEQSKKRQALLILNQTSNAIFSTFGLANG